MGFGTNIMKSLMFVFNGIVWVLGLVLFIVGIVVLVEGKNWNDIIDDKTVPVSVLLIVVGFIICVVGFLGCFGAIKQNSTMLLIYSIILAVIIIIQLVAGILAFIFSDEAETIVKNNSNEFISDYDGKSQTSQIMDVLMEEFGCCGADGPGDFATKTDASKWTQQNVPDSCCKKMKTECGWNYVPSDENIYDQGCTSKTVEFFKDNLKLAGICGLAFVAVEIIQIVLACVLRRDYNTVV